MRRRYMDAMALVRRYGKPDIFLTMTCNPNWDEIRQELYPGQTPQDRPDLVVRVFRAKLEELKNKLLKKDILGKVRAYVYVVEFQKRGLPHAHFLLIMEGRYKLTCPEQYDRLISAELPNKKKYPELYKLVVKHMMHGPCGALNLNPECPCTKGRPSCKNHYPRPFHAATLQGKDSYPLYKRREDGCKAMVRKEWLDNRWVVPYNPHLLRYFNCHINVEACGSIKAVKYLFKYIYKGHDRASIVVSEADKNGDIDEIKQYRDARQIGRIVSAHPAEGERYYLRVLLNHVTGATSYEDLRTVNGEILPTFREAAERRGLIEGDNTLDESLTESTLYEMPSSLRWLFATILVFCEPSDVRGLWEKHLDAMSEDYRRSNPSKVAAEQLVLIDIRNMLQSMGKEIESFPLPDIQEEYDTSIGVTREIFEESTIELNVEDTYLSDSLNSDQRAAYDEIMSAIDRDEGGVFFVDGPGGTGKTFLYRALLAMVRGQKKIAIATATSSVAASIMPGGRTAHSRFKIPLGIDDGGCCSFTK
uniref:ATP-dependent DNA helicase n=1 Tax=Aegilops tauschii subsp. strangulata TaxID=200361 RepID=A0A453JVC8_AEGTS